MNTYAFNLDMVELLGEAGAEAVIDAINFYLMNSDDFACEEDKIVLLSILLNSRYTSLYKPECSALLNFEINFKKRCAPIE